MDKKNINSIDIRTNDFDKYVWEQLLISRKEKEFLKNILKKSDVYLFGGIIRDYFLHTEEKKPSKLKHRDIDIVIKKNNRIIIAEIKKYLLRETNYGGYKLKINDRIWDVWNLNNTWTFQKNTQLNYKLELVLPKTSFFNLTAIVYSFKKKKFIYHDSFKKALNKNVLDIINFDNPYPELCIIKTYEYVKKYNMQMSKDLLKYIVSQYPNNRKKITNVQKKHYSRIRYSRKEIDEFYDGVQKKYNDMNLPRIKRSSRNKNQINLFSSN